MEMESKDITEVVNEVKINPQNSEQRSEVKNSSPVYRIKMYGVFKPFPMLTSLVLPLGIYDEYELQLIESKGDTVPQGKVLVAGRRDKYQVGIEVESGYKLKIFSHIPYDERFFLHFIDQMAYNSLKMGGFPDAFNNLRSNLEVAIASYENVATICPEQIVSKIGVVHYHVGFVFSRIFERQVYNFNFGINHEIVDYIAELVLAISNEYRDEFLSRLKRVFNAFYVPRNFPFANYVYSICNAHEVAYWLVGDGFIMLIGDERLKGALGALVSFLEEEGFEAKYEEYRMKVDI